MPKQHKKAVVLIVDDERDIRESIKMCLVAEDYTVLEASNAKEALILLQQGLKIKLVILDLMMPVMTGWEFLALRKADQTLSKLPVIVVSASVRDQEIRSDVNAVIHKPFNVDALLHSVHQCLKPEESDASI